MSEYLKKPMTGLEAMNLTVYMWDSILKNMELYGLPRVLSTDFKKAFLEDFTYEHGEQLTLELYGKELCALCVYERIHPYQKVCSSCPLYGQWVEGHLNSECGNSQSPYEKLYDSMLEFKSEALILSRVKSLVAFFRKHQQRIATESLISINNRNFTKYSVRVEGKVLDFRYQKTPHDFLAYNFYIGDIFIGQVFSGKTWTAVSFHTVCKYGAVAGFKTRYDASVFLLTVCGFYNK